MSEQHHIPSGKTNDGYIMTAGGLGEVSMLTSLRAQAGARIAELERKVQAQQARITTLETEAVTDELTALRNRKGFFKGFERELGRVARGHSDGGLLLLIDVENYQAIADVHTRSAGDTALRLVGRALAAQIRCMDIAARIGEASFVLLMADTPSEDAIARAQGLSRQLNHLSLVHGCTEIGVHAAIGMREYGEGDSADSIFRDADTALNRRKNGIGSGQTRFRDTAAPATVATKSAGASSELTTAPLQADKSREAIF
jgi:diguanylate cyclase (GGDEF)-like protein